MALASRCFRRTLTLRAFSSISSPRSNVLHSPQNPGEENYQKPQLSSFLSSLSSPETSPPPPSSESETPAPSSKSLTPAPSSTPSSSTSLASIGFSKWDLSGEKLPQELLDYFAEDPMEEKPLPPPPDIPPFFEGCDYKHWLITIGFPKDKKLTAEEKVEIYVQTAAKVVGSVEEAKTLIYACSTTTYTGFNIAVSQETSEKFKDLPEVQFILPDCYIDPKKKQYGGDEYINGKIIPRPVPTPKPQPKPQQIDDPYSFGLGDVRKQGVKPRCPMANGDRRGNYKGERRDATVGRRAENRDPKGD